jgi:hypothetical protein
LKRFDARRVNTAGAAYAKQMLSSVRKPERNNAVYEPPWKHIDAN